MKPGSPNRSKCHRRVVFLVTKLCPFLLLSSLLPLCVLYWPADLGLGLGGFHTWRQGLPLPNTTTGGESNGKFGWISSAYGNNTGYRRNLLALARSLREHGGAQDGPLMILDDGSMDEAFRKQLHASGCEVVTVDPIHVPEKVAATLDEPRHLPNFIRLRLWNLTQFSRLVFIDSDMLFVKDVAPIRALPCNSAVPQRRGSVNGGMLVLCPDRDVAAAMARKLEDDGGVYPVAEQTFISNFFWGQWHYASTCLNARASDYRPWFKAFVRKHLLFWPPRDICELEDSVLIHFNGAAKPWSPGAAKHYPPELMDIYRRAVDQEEST